MNHQHYDPPCPTLTEGARAPKVLYGPRGDVVAEVGVPKPIPFGFRPTESTEESTP